LQIPFLVSTSEEEMSMPAKKTAKKSVRKRSVARKRELIEPHKGDKRFVRRDNKGQFNEVDDVSRSLSQDRRRKAKTVAKKGQGDKGDRRTASADR